MKKRRRDSADHLLALLNGRSKFGIDHKSMVRAFFLARTMGRKAEGRPSPETLRTLNHWHPATDEQYATAAKQHRERLRDFVDRWIASGKDARGHQIPRSRNLDGAPDIVKAMQKWMLEMKIIMLPPVEGSRGIHTPHIPAMSDDPVTAAHEDAVRLFSSLVMNPTLSHRIAKCRECGLYFFWKKPKTLYVHSPFCSDCEKSGGAKERMQKLRNKERGPWLEAAADALNEWRTSKTLQKQYPRYSPFITSKIKRYGKKLTSVTRNIEKIEDLADEKAKLDTGVRKELRIQKAAEINKGRK